MISCVYRIINLVNNKIYIGSSKDFIKRIKHHLYELLNNKHINKKLQAAFNKYGLLNFRAEILETCDTNQLLEKEQNYLDSLKPDYNLCKLASGGDSITNHPNRNEMIEFRRETLQKYRQSDEGLKLAKERMLGENNPRFGKTLSKEEKEKLTKSREHLKGTTRSDEVKRKVSESLKRYHAERKAK